MLIVLKLITGEELIGETDSDVMDDHYINLTDVLQIMKDVDEDYYSLYFVPWMPYADENLFTFRRRDCITIVHPNENMIEKYSDFLGPPPDQEHMEALKQLFDSLRSMSKDD